MAETQSLWELSSELANHANLRDIRLFNSSCELRSPSSPRMLSYTLEANIEFQTLGEDGTTALVVTGNYDLKVHESIDPEADEEPADIGNIDFALAAMYFLDGLDDRDEPLNDEQIEAFALTTGQLALYPYAREFVADMTARMGLPPLHMGTLVVNALGRVED